MYHTMSDTEVESTIERVPTNANTATIDLIRRLIEDAQCIAYDNTQADDQLV